VAYKPPYLLLYVNDLLGSHYVDLMDMEQFGWYMRLLVRSWQWDTPCYLPNDMSVIRSILRIGRRQKEVEVFQERFQIVYERFSISEDGKSIYHPKLVEQYEELKAKHAKLAEAGLRGGLSNGKGRPKHPDSDSDSDSIKEPSAFALPDWITQNPQLLESWESFVDMRKRIKHKLTSRSAALAIGELQRLKSAGNDPVDVLNQSVLNDWRGVFEVKGKSNGGFRADKSQQRDNAANEAIADVLGMDHRGVETHGESAAEWSDRSPSLQDVRAAPGRSAPVTIEGSVRKMR